MSEWVKVDECPDPCIGLRWNEMFSYYGEVIAEVHKEVVWADRPYTGERLWLIDDTSSKRPYILSVSEFKKKFSYQSCKGCWVRFKFPEPQGSPTRETQG